MKLLIICLSIVVIIGLSSYDNIVYATGNQKQLAVAKMPNKKEEITVTSEFIPVKLDSVEDSEDIEVKKRPLFYILGGVRLKLKFDETKANLTDLQLSKNPKYSWKMGAAGKSCTGFTNATCTDKTSTDTIEGSNEIWWEPPNWNLDYSAPTVLTISFDDPENNPKKEVRFRIANRLLKPPYSSKDKVEGHDVAMLEHILWFLGNTPENKDVREDKPYEYVGYLAGRIEEKDQRRFTIGCEFNACKDKSKKTIQSKTIERLVWSFKNANEIDGSYTKDDFTPSDNNITQKFLNVLKEQWDHYLSSINTYNIATLDSSHSSYDTWVKNSITEWDTSYTDEVNKKIATLVDVPDFTREKLLKGWIPKEAGPNTTHWGGAAKDYRMVAGGADRRMSLGFTQIQSRYIYGLVKGDICSRLSGINYMSPIKNISALPIWSVGIGCGESFQRAFTNLGYDGTYTNNGKDKLVQAIYGNKEAHLLVTDTKVINFTDGSYERLTKAIAGYNQGGTKNSDWDISLPSMLKNLEKGASCKYTDNLLLKRCKGLSYSIHVKESAGLPLATYIWRVVKTGKTPQENENICFKYGEKLWKDNYSWSFVKDKALNDLPLVDGKGNLSVKMNECPN